MRVGEAVEKWRELGDKERVRRSEERDPKLEKPSLREVPRNGFVERDDAIVTALVLQQKMKKNKKKKKKEEFGGRSW